MSLCLGQGQKVHRALLAALWERKAKPQPFRQAEKKKQTLVSEEGDAASSSLASKCLDLTAIHVLGMAGMDKEILLKSQTAVAISSLLLPCSHPKYVTADLNTWGFPLF